MARNESFISLQKGLVPAIWYQFIMNGCRFGLYQVCDNLRLTRNEHGDVIFYRSIICGVGSGIVGSFLGSPFYLIKTHLQSQSESHIAVGHQHKHSSMTAGFRTIFVQNGIKGLWRGSVASITRVSVGGSIQLTSFATVKTFLDKKNWIDVNSWYGTLLSSMIGSCFVVVSMTPFDVVSTRLYNQPVDPKTGRGQLYRGIPDCMIKIFRTEGILGFYKGFGASFLRLGPHTVLSIFFWQLLRKEYLLYLKQEQTLS
ncbi:solute carrier family 25 member 35 isoform X2 [Dermatophagoides farinae]